MQKLSIIIITKDQEHNIERCLESIKDISDDIVVLEDNSKDRTIEICRKYTRKIFQQKWQGYAKQKNIALSKTTHDWVLWIDSDEELTPEARSEIKTILSKDSDVLGYELKRKTFFLNRYMHCFGNDYILRFFKKTKEVYFPENVSAHEHLYLPGKTAKLDRAVINHYPYKDFDEYFEKFINYADLFAQDAIKKDAKKVRFLKLFFAFPLTFFKLYIIRSRCNNV